MKKIIWLIIMIMFFVTGHAFAMEAMSNKELSRVEGKSGISVIADDLKMYLEFNGLYYTDTDGLVQGVNNNPMLGMDSALNNGREYGGASIGIKNFSTMLQINAITGYDPDNTDKTAGLRSHGRPLQGNYDSSYDFSNCCD